MSSQIVLNSSHYNENENAFIYKFPIQQTFSKGDKIALTSVNVFNSFYNVNAEQGNQIKIKFPSGSGYVTTDVTIEDGFYDADTFSLFLRKACLDNYLFSDGTDGKVTFYIEIGNSETQYASFIRTYAVDTNVVPPIGATWTPPTTRKAIQICLGKLGPLFGFPSDPNFDTFYGATILDSLTTYSIETPQINPFNSIIMRCNVVRNSGLSFPTDFVYSMGLNSAFGSLISSPPHEPLYNELVIGQHSEIVITLHDNTMSKLKLLDTNVLLVVSIIKGI